MTTSIICGTVEDMLPTLDAESYDAVLCDPPYGLGFMGKAWDHGVPSADIWREVLRVVKPGGMLLAFGGTRTFHRLAVNIEDAGWEDVTGIEMDVDYAQMAQHRLDRWVPDSLTLEMEETR